MGVQELCKEILLKKKKGKRIWMRDWIRRRNELGASSRLLRELAEEDPSSYMNVLRLSLPKFQRIAKIGYTNYQKKDTHLREAGYFKSHAWIKIYSIRARKLNPRLLLKNVNLQSAEAVINDIASHLKFVTKLKHFQSTNILVEFFPELRDLFLQKRYVSIVWKKSPVSDHIRIVKC
nr:unnamed protein product [Callosobruchus analis]